MWSICRRFQGIDSVKFVMMGQLESSIVSPIIHILYTRIYSVYSTYIYIYKLHIPRVLASNWNLN